METGTRQGKDSYQGTSMSMGKNRTRTEPTSTSTSTDGNENEARDGHVSGYEQEHGSERDTYGNEKSTRRKRSGWNGTRIPSTDGNENEAGGGHVSGDEQDHGPGWDTYGNEHKARDEHVTAGTEHGWKRTRGRGHLRERKKHETDT